MKDSLEKLWEEILSRQPDRIRAAYNALTVEDQAAVAAHLKRMASEEGWQPVQIESAQVALHALGKDREGGHG